MDCRCPETVRLLEEHELTEAFDDPKIEPILVRTARVLHETHVVNIQDRLIITCPCTPLRDFTAKQLRGLSRIECYTRKEFIERVGMKSLGAIDTSPIPLGFFDDAFEHVLKLSQENKIFENTRQLIQQEEKTCEIVEMLY